ncbi:hypothetical protein LB941_07275 [Ligilactobacillus sp. WILCCON 0076]|uniref:Uncharacterized protein n=1 Tax=Ligilactobacillus ubinensis TaxID=2876789 RepID=A0A9X2FKP5_9LACO|nr:hypothetical protein [Ligilactobacillus ubinensis]MCP0887135.1 hypothetical protein [Ligilactobacillus ubinensis]
MLEKIKNISKTIYISIAIAIILIIGLIYYVNNKKTNVLTNDNINMQFNGWNGEGTATYDSATVSRQMIKIMAQKAKLGEYLTSELTSGYISTDSEQFAALSDEDKDKITKVNRWISETNIRVNKESNLKNGDTVTVTLTTNDDKTNPIKADSKSYTVKGLKKVKSVSTKSILSKLKASFVGFNGTGQIILSSKSKQLNNESFTVKKNGSLSNGDTVKVVASSSLFQKNGTTYTGSRTVTFKVAGLTDITKITNIDAVQKLTDSLVNDQYTSNDYETYTNTFVNLYAIPSLSSDDTDADNSSYNGTSSTSKSVEVNDKTAKRIFNQKLSIVALYKIQSSYDDDPQYVTVTINNLKYKDTTIDVDNINTDDNSSVSTISNSLYTEQHNLKADGVLLK